MRWRSAGRYPRATRADPARRSRRPSLTPPHARRLGVHVLTHDGLAAGPQPSRRTWRDRNLEPPTAQDSRGTYPRGRAARRAQNPPGGADAGRRAPARPAAGARAPPSRGRGGAGAAGSGLRDRRAAGAASPRRGPEDHLPAGAAGQRAPRRPAGRDPRPPSCRGRRRDGLGQDHAAAQDLPGAGTRDPRRDRPHAAAAPGGAHGRPAHRRRARRRPRRSGRLRRAVQRQLQRAHVGAVGHRRPAAGRDPARPAAAPLRHHHHRRGPRALVEHRLPARLPAPAAAQAARPQADHHLGDDRPRAVRQALRRRAGGRGQRPHLPGRGPLPAAGADRRRPRARPARGDRRRRGRAAAREPRGRRAGVPQRRARDPRHRRRAARPAARRHRRPAALRAALDRRPAEGLQVPQPAPRRAGDQRRRDVADGPGHQVRRRHGPGADEPLQRAAEGAAAADRADLPGLGRPAQGPLRPHLGRHLHPALRRAGLPRAPALHRPRDPAHQPRVGDPADGRAGPRRGQRLPVPRPARRAAGPRRRQPPARARRDRSRPSRPASG